MKCWRMLVLVAVVVAGGCPRQPSGEGQPAVTAQITISATHVDPGVAIVVSGEGSSSRNGAPLQYHWDFGGQAAADAMTATYRFSSPGLYAILLQVTDPTGAVGTASVDLRVRGSATPEAVIQASTNSGSIPLAVQFDGSGSSAADDVIHDYEWDFGDGSSPSGERAPLHIYRRVGTFTVTLTVTTAGGLNGSTTTVITAGVRNGSLQFDGSQVATLSLGQAQPLESCTLEAWFKATTADGTFVSIGSGALVIEVRPSSNTIRFQYAGQSQEVSAANLAGLWRHIALAYNAAGDATLYLDGNPLKNAPGQGAISASEVSLGPSFVGKLADVRFWSVARSGDEIKGNYDRRLSGTPQGLLGYWRLDEGSGQSLGNLVGPAGTRGASDATEASDPAWSTDGPPLK